MPLKNDVACQHNCCINKSHIREHKNFSSWHKLSSSWGHHSFPTWFSGYSMVILITIKSRNCYLILTKYSLLS